MPRFVILRHDAPAGVHWDLMIEIGESLRTWSLAEEPRLKAPQPARALPDHRIAYLDYEGPVSGQRGSVARWDYGQYDVREQAGDRFALALSGQRLRALAELRQVKEDQWELLIRPQSLSDGRIP